MSSMSNIQASVTPPNPNVDSQQYACAQIADEDQQDFCLGLLKDLRRKEEEEAKSVRLAIRAESLSKAGSMPLAA